MVLVEQFVERFGKERMAFLCADREFIGERWVGRPRPGCPSGCG